MCDICIDQFDSMSARLNEMLYSYRVVYESGRMRPTPAERVHDNAEILISMSQGQTGRDIIAWYLAVAMERLTALECAGIPT